MPVTDTDHGFRELLAHVRGALPTTVKVGVPDTPRADGTPNDEIAAIHEFGLGHVPQRSFIRAWVDENENRIDDKIGSGAEAVVRGRMNWGDTMKHFADYCVEGIRERIRRNIPPPLAPSTIKRKGNDLALVETEQLINSITSEIEIQGQPSAAPVVDVLADTILGADPLAAPAVDAYADTELPE